MTIAEDDAMTPTFDNKDAMIFVGVRAFIPFAEMHKIGGLWEQFGGLYAGISDKVGRQCYGLSQRATEPGAGFDYMCAVLSTNADQSTGGLSSFVTPKQTYAQFEHDGHVSTLHTLCRYILDDWSKQADPGINFEGGCDLIEAYAEDFDPAGTGGISVWTPLRAA